MLLVGSWLVLMKPFGSQYAKIKYLLMETLAWVNLLCFKSLPLVLKHPYNWDQ
jgi:hypothetical protein